MNNISLNTILLALSAALIFFMAHTLYDHAYGLSVVCIIAGSALIASLIVSLYLRGTEEDLEENLFSDEEDFPIHSPVFTRVKTTVVDPDVDFEDAVLDKIRQGLEEGTEKELEEALCKAFFPCKGGEMKDETLKMLIDDLEKEEEEWPEAVEDDGLLMSEPSPFNYISEGVYLENGQIYEKPQGLPVKPVRKDQEDD